MKGAGEAPKPAHYLISCGGTGGHLAPGIALAQELGARGHAVTLLISEKPVDAQLAAKYRELTFARIPGAPWSLRPAGLGRFFRHQGRGLRVAFALVRSLRPRAIIGFGGFTSGAIIVAGALRRVPVALHEANRVPGRAVRTLASLARRVYLPPGVQLPRGHDARVRSVGLPLRREMQAQPRDEACRFFGFDPRLPLVVVLGGSQGAAALNEWARSAGPRLAATGVQLACITGQRQGEAETLQTTGPGGPVLTRFLPFCDQMATLLSAADLAVSRAGAGTLAELVRCRTPAVLVPYPFAADNHQAANAEYLVTQEAARMLSQAAGAEALTSAVEALLADAAARGAMRAALERLDRTDAARELADDLENLSVCPRGGGWPAGRPAAA